ncbi:hypothetical protein [Cryobacterium sp. M23]|uniref:hypothetical protein n=1 Tax=Cryobacterium sp. M23 TaxID=2048292 RepID=UPI0011B07C23|nr:hypothetical protein [Cryobacterium sp. M23]
MSSVGLEGHVYCLKLDRGEQIQISLEFDSTESLTSYLPTETVGHAYEVEALPVSSAIGTTGRIRWNSAPGEGLLPTGEARWSVPSAQATAQLNLLIAGALLGIAASVAVELLLEFLRSFRQKPTPPRRT